MKKYLITIAAISFLAACGNNTDTAKTTDSAATTPVPETPAANDPSSNPDYQKGLTLIASSDCLGCHKVEEKLNGPAYRDVANKYENTDDNVKMLAGKIIKGGSGVWGSVAMTPHPALSQADAEQMVKYILLLRNK